MALVVDCPDEATLERLLLGDLPDELMDSWGRHLLECQLCAARAGTLSAADDLTVSLRDAVTVSAASDDALAGELQQRLHHLRVVRPVEAQAEPTQAFSAPPETSADANSRPSSSASAPTFSFLGPAQAPGEIGRLGSYRILKVLGQGGMGVVFQAEDPRLGRLCALKVMLPEVAHRSAMKERFLREARAAAQIEHDHIIPIYQVDEDRGVPYIAMPFLKGMSLEDWLRKKQKDVGSGVKLPEILKLGRQIARGLAAAHGRGLIHRDIKPANIWLDASAGGRVKILDFGLARLSEAGGERNLTQSGAIMGTPAYMAPEQARGEKLDGRADLFSLGVILYRLCTGELPFKGKDMLSTLTALATHTPAPPHTLNQAIPEPLSQLVMRLLAKAPDQRTQSTEEVIAALQAIEKILVAPAERPETHSARSPSEDLPLIHAHDADSVAARLKPKREVPASAQALAAVAMGAVVLLLAGILVFWQTPEGVVRIEINDPEIQVRIDRDGPTITDADREPIRLQAGKHGLTITRGDLTFDTTTFQLRKGTETRLRIDWLADSKMRVTQDNIEIGSHVAPGKRTTAHVTSGWHGWPADAPRPAVAPFDAAQAQQFQEAWAGYLGTTVEVTDAIGIKMALIPPGEFLMGSSDEQMAAAVKLADQIKTHQSNKERIQKDERPQHKVVISKPILMGITEVTVGQFRRFVEASNYVTEAERYGFGNASGVVLGDRVTESSRGVSWRAPGYTVSDDMPVTQVTWNDAVAFCRWLSSREKATYRLPTNAEWEYACRAGTTTLFSFGNDENLLAQFGWHNRNARDHVQPVGMKPANGFGLHDMHGNVWEWCLDFYDESWYQRTPLRNPQGPASGSSRVIRGGHWQHYAVYCRSAYRSYFVPTGRGNFGGIRCVREIDR
jgi:formylglycine-generating enzyme required for sulfatase activity/serine/threonine protein kinase